MKQALIRFRNSQLYIWMVIIVPVVTGVSSVMLYLSAEALRDQAAQHQVDYSSLQNRVNEKDAQIILLNEQIKQKFTQVEILKSQVELLQKVNKHHESLALIDKGEVEAKLSAQIANVNDLQTKLNAFKQLGSKFGQANEIAEVIASLESDLKISYEEIKLLKSKLEIYEPNFPQLAVESLDEGSSVTLLNGSLTVGLIDAYGSWGYINVSSFDEVIHDRGEIRPGKNIAINLKNITYVLIIDSITEKSIKFSLFSRGE